ncbi:GNAT family N-acetyltransferase [Nocardia cyriacigeorgica]|uniref:GNAT family N-acetyltransferase n=1 Tax=Nocardia cyriacigeorgica TaxID=135487 RepID=UPI0024543A73|nr:GNAT family N-acetyltransferase [Nocardia cyriacigeorgica]
MSTEVRNNTALERFEIYVDGAIAGYAEYQDTNAERAFVHTEIYSQYEGQGYGRVLVETALNQTRAPHHGAGTMWPKVRHIVETPPAKQPKVPQYLRAG